MVNAYLNKIADVQQYDGQKWGVELTLKWLNGYAQWSRYETENYS